MQGNPNRKTMRVWDIQFKKTTNYLSLKTILPENCYESFINNSVAELTCSGSPKT